jgi:hypothetical protein
MSVDVQSRTRDDEIPAGYDFFRTDSGRAVLNFQKIPIPAGFFSERSLEFNQVVRFVGRPLPRSYFGGEDITHVDTVVQRKSSVLLPPPYPSTGEPIDIELIGLALESVAPLRVRVGRHVELWDAVAELSRAKPSVGQMTITKLSHEGGTFDSELTVLPSIRFIRRCDSKERVLDVGALPLPEDVLAKLVMHSTGSPWLHSAPGVLKLEGRNDHFVAGAPGLVDEAGDATQHEPGEPPSCAVVDIKLDSRYLTVGQTRLYTADVSPGGGTYKWTINRGSDHAMIVPGTEQQNPVIVQGTTLSVAANDITLTVTYASPGGAVCSREIDLTTISVTLSIRFQTGQTWAPESENGCTRSASYGNGVLGPVWPGHPTADVTGFYKNVEIKGVVEPNDPSIDGTFRFHQRRWGRSYRQYPGLPPVTDSYDCPNQLVGCGDNPDESLAAQDDAMSPGGAIYMVDGPGIEIKDEQGRVDLRCADKDFVLHVCMNFRTWVEVDGQQCSPDFLWYAISRVKCDGQNFVPDDPPNPVGPGVTACVLPGAQPAIGADLPSALRALTAASGFDRLQARRVIASVIESDDLGAADQAQLVTTLTQIARSHAPKGAVDSSKMLAIELLGELRAPEAVEVLLEQVTRSFPRPVVSNRDAPPSTVAGSALVKLGNAAVPPIVDRAEAATDEEWRILAHVLGLMDDRAAVRRAICSALDTHTTERAEARLARWMTSFPATAPNIMGGGPPEPSASH